MSKILIAEDEKQLSIGIAVSLAIQGYDVTEVNNGSKALEAIIKMQLNKTPYDLLICDVQMPEMTGEELLKKLKESHITLPSMVITGYGEKELLVRLMRAGCRNFLDKPFDHDLLCKQVNNMLAESASTYHKTMTNDINRKLLIIDTEEFDRNMMGRIFGSTYSMTYAACIEEAAKVMKECNPGVVYFEVRQSDTAQYTIVADAVEKHCPHASLIVAVTDNSLEFERFIRSRDVFYYMLRPFNLKELWDAVESGFKSAEKTMT